MEVPFDSMATLPYYSPQPKGFVANFFRIDTPAGQQKEYSCFECDNTSPACFHMPTYFRTLWLV